MANVRLNTGPLFGGVSRQHPAVRNANQVEDATNAIFSVRDGAYKRPGFEWLQTVTGLTDGGSYRLHPLDQSADEKYLILYGDSILRVFTWEGYEALVTIDSAAQTYIDLNDATASEMRLASSQDYTLLANTTVQVAALTSDSFEVASVHQDYDFLTTFKIPAPDEYRLAEDATVDEAPGYWKYAVSSGDNGFAMFEADQFDGSWDRVTDDWNDSGKNPMGFKVGFGRYDHSSAGATYTHAAKTINDTSAFTGYTWTAGDQLNVTGGTNITVGWYEIASKDSNDQVTLVDAPGTGDNADTTFDGVGVEYAVLESFTGGNQALSLEEIAWRFTKKLRGAGASDAYVFVTGNESGADYFGVVSPYRGTGAQVVTIRHNPESATDITSSAGDPFRVSGSTTTAGTGSPSTDTQAIGTRWERVPVPNQANAKIDATKMPVKITKTYGDYETLVKGDTPYLYYRMQDTSGAAVDEMGVANATLTTAAYQQGAMIDDATANSITFGTPSAPGYASVSGISIDLSSVSFSFEAWVQNLGTDNEVAIFLFSDGSVGGMSCVAKIGTSQLETKVLDTSGNADVSLASSLPAGFFDGNAFHLAITYEPGVALRVYVNGLLHDSTTTATVSPAPTMVDATLMGFPLYDSEIRAGDVAVYKSVLTAAQILEHYRQGRVRANFSVDPITWGSRPNGTDASNPVPSLWRDARSIADVTFFENRLVLAGGESVVLSRAGLADDLFEFYVEDATNLIDSDPIDVTLRSGRAATIDSVTEFNRALIVLTKSGLQFELPVQDSLTPTNAVANVTTSYQTIEGVKPGVMGNSMLFMSNSAGYGQLFEYYYSDSFVNNTANEASIHVEGYLPATISAIAVVPNLQSALILPSDGYGAYLYRTFWNGSEKVQSAFSFLDTTITTSSDDDRDRFVDVASIGNAFYLLVERNRGGTHSYIIQRMDITTGDPPTGLAFAPEMDSMVLIRGKGLVADTTFTLPYTLDANKSYVLVASDDATTPGEVLTPTTVSGNEIVVEDTVRGNQWYYVGELYTMDVELSEAYPRDGDGRAILDSDLVLNRVSAAHRATGSYQIEVEIDNRPKHTATFSDTTTSTGTHDTGVGGRSGDTTISIVDSSVYPTSIAYVENIGTGKTRRL